ncbi:beta-galactosidase [Bifidobacterium leontopitheci]|uniref:beta-galactosidase n=1 Tax=Bifidobacterium leontopitheci TaxID=2650774 RepID=A0A6I1GQ52_9BIFI|nr:beta-galactosidase [Bifidobacterium leontopitheci]KAB7790228.1 beta-galactosidase [Bifidobacterium leontopitheci]
MSLSTTKALGRSDSAIRRPFRWPTLLTDNGAGLAYGGDYNPDQWPETTWDEDIRLMRQAHVNTVALGIFSWSRLEPREGEYDFDWLDRIIDKLGRAGIAVDLASATAAAPLWLYERHPEVLPVDRYGHVVNPGSRQSWRPTSPVFRTYALELCRRLAERYKDHPAVTAWHMNNEYGWNNRNDYSDDSQRAFREWCRAKYGTIDALNEAWGTAFWSQHVNDFDEILLPRHMGGDAMANPSQQLDYERFGSDALKEFYKAERDAIARICPDKPFTTNFMVSTDQCAMDYADWSDEVDFVSNDHYFHEGESHLDELACSDSLVSGFALGRPWYLMEHSTSAVQWKPLNARKRHGELIRDALAHVAMGADAINFFQWRQSRSGAEAFHSAMLPHAGAGTRVFRDVCELGGLLKRLGEAGLQGSRVAPSRTAILFDADSEWATRCQTLPSMKLSHWHDVRDWYRAFLDVADRADVVPLRADWSGYDTIVLPTVLVLSAADVRRLADFVRGGGTAIVGYATGLVDERFHVGLGGYPGAGDGLLRDVLGVRGEEFNIIGDEGEDGCDGCGCGGDGVTAVGDPATVGLSNGAVCRLWANVVDEVAPDAAVLARYEGDTATEWELDGTPAIVRHDYGDGTAYFVGCDFDRGDIARFLRDVGYGRGRGRADCADGWADEPSGQSDARILHVTRETDGRRFDFYINRAHDDTVVREPAGETLIAYRCDTGVADGAGVADAAGAACRAVTLHRNGVLVTTTASRTQ